LRRLFRFRAGEAILDRREGREGDTARRRAADISGWRWGWFLGDIRSLPPCCGGVVEESLGGGVGAGQGVEDVTDQIRNLADRALPEEYPVGVGVPSMLDLDRSTPLKQPNFPGWGGCLAASSRGELGRLSSETMPTATRGFGRGVGRRARGFRLCGVHAGTGIGGGIVLGDACFWEAAVWG
jgi:hypothetical protein